MNQHHISRWETGQVRPSRENLAKVATALGVLPWELHLAQELLDRSRVVEKAVEEYALA